MGTNFCTENTQNTQGSVGQEPTTRAPFSEIPNNQKFKTDLEESIEDLEHTTTPLKKFVAMQNCNRLVIASNNLLLSSSNNVKKFDLAPQLVAQIEYKIQKRQKRCSIDVAVNNSQLITKPPSLTEKAVQGFFYSRIEIAQESFIILKKEDIYQQYKMLDYLGKGAFGSVYKAVSLRDGSIRAIKIIKRLHFLRNCAKQAQFFAELELLRKIDHPNIIKLFDVYESSQNYFVVTEYCDGGSLIEYLNERNLFNERIVRTIIHQIIECLNYIHRLQIVHRDIKLENIVLLQPLKDDSKPEDVEIKLLDFGSATLMKNARIISKDIVGTASYVAPEVIKGFFNEKCDIWSAGVVLFMLVTSSSPFKHKNQQVTFERVLKHKLNYDQPVWNRISPQVKSLTRAMLERDLGERISAKEALSHSWFKNHTLTTSIQVPSYFDKLLHYNVQNNLISVVESYLAYRNVSQNDRNQIAAVFKAIDKNNDGLIDRAELIAQYTDLKLSQEIKVEELITRLDKDKSGLISLSEFITAVVSRDKLFKKPLIEEAFDHFDSEKKGYLSKETLTSLLKGGDREQIDDLLFEMDEDEDGKISKHEFVNYFMDNGYLFDENGEAISNKLVL